MPTTGSKHVHSGRIPYLDGWRGLAVLLVLIAHFAGDHGRYPIGVLGVEFFFVLSGRLMADILFVERFPLPEFYRRRISRVFPGMAAFVILLCAATQWSSYAFKPLAAALALTFTLNYAMVVRHGVAAIENLWSLCIEEHAYAFLGVVAFLARRRMVSPLAAIAIAGAASLLDGAICTTVLHQAYRTVYWRTDAHVASILLGAFAYLALRGKTLPSWTSLAALAGALAMWGMGDAYRYTFGSGLLALSVAALDQSPEFFRSALSFRPLMLAGLVSYSLYLWQQPFHRAVFDGKLHPILGFLLAAACGLASYYVVEQPARRFLNRHWKSFGRRPAPEPGAELAN